MPDTISGSPALSAEDLTRLRAHAHSRCPCGWCRLLAAYDKAVADAARERERADKWREVSREVDAHNLRLLHSKDALTIERDQLAARVAKLDTLAQPALDAGVRVADLTADDDLYDWFGPKRRAAAAVVVEAARRFCEMNVHANQDQIDAAYEWLWSSVRNLDGDAWGDPRRHRWAPQHLSGCFVDVSEPPLAGQPTPRTFWVCEPGCPAAARVAELEAVLKSQLGLNGHTVGCTELRAEGAIPDCTPTCREIQAALRGVGEKGQASDGP